jgi:hypothetical protein
MDKKESKLAFLYIIMYPIIITIIPFLFLSIYLALAMPFTFQEFIYGTLGLFTIPFIGIKISSQYLISIKYYSEPTWIFIYTITILILGTLYFHKIKYINLVRTILGLVFIGFGVISDAVYF